MIGMAWFIFGNGRFVELLPLDKDTEIGEREEGGQQKKDERKEGNDGRRTYRARKERLSSGSSLHILSGPENQTSFPFFLSTF